MSHDVELEQLLRRHFAATAARPTTDVGRLAAVIGRVDGTSQVRRLPWLPGRRVRPGVLRFAIVASAVLVALIALGSLVYVGASLVPTRLPGPFGPASNGALVYARDGELWTTDANGGAARPIVTGSEVESSPVFSRDGTRVAFLRTLSAGVSDLMIANPDGTGVHRVGVSGVSGFAWSPTGRELAVIHDDPVRSTLLSIVDADSGTVVRDLDIGQLWPAGWVDWRPTEGSELILDVHPTRGSPVQRSIYAIRTDGTGLRMVAPYAVDHGMTWSYDHPELTPDGAAVIYSAFTGSIKDSVPTVSDAHVWRRELDTGVEDAMPLRDEVSATLSPDGTTILYLGLNTGQLYLGPVDDSAADVPVGPKMGLTNAGLTYAFSPDGRQIVATNTPDAGVATTAIIDVASGAMQSAFDGVTPTWQRLAP